MSNTNSLKALIKNIADAIRNRTSKTATMSIEEMPNEIASIQGPYPTQSKSVNVKKNGEVVVTPDEGYVLDKVTANVDVTATSDNNAKFWPTSQHSSYSAANGVSPEGLSYINLAPYADKINGYYTADRFLAYCDNLEKVDGLENITFERCTRLSEAFSSCRKLTSIDVSNFNTSKVQNMSYMFSSCVGLTSLDLSNFDTSEVQDMGGMFYDCASLTSLDLSNFDTSKVQDMGGVFHGFFGICPVLSTVTFGNNWGSNESLTTMPLGSRNGLNKTSILDLFNKLATRTNSPTLVLDNATVKSQLTEEEIAIATNKGWVVS